jgi:hypothetical protein
LTERKLEKMGIYPKNAPKKTVDKSLAIGV